MAPTPSSSTLWLAVPAGLVAAIVVAALVTGNLDRGDEPEDGTPAAAVSGYLDALHERDVEALRSTLSSELRDDCPADELRRTTRGRDRDDERVTLVSSEPIDDTVEVTVRRTRYGGEPPFGDSTFDTTEVFALEREDDRWVITEVPWAFGVCGGWSR